MAKEAKKTIKLQQTGSGASGTKVQKATLTGLGLGKMHKVVEIEDTPAVRGMIIRVNHLVKEVN